MRRILFLGSGLMAESVLNYLLLNKNNLIHIASNVLKDAQHLAETKDIQRCTFSQIDVNDAQELKKIVFTADIVISYVPSFLHLPIAKVCLQLKKHLVTASYISDQLMQLHEQAVKKGLIFLNELGLDPGIDHMATMKNLQEIKEKGGKVIEYQSWCGGLPSPGFCDNPLGYKFTWSPIGALRALKNKAIYIEDNKLIQIQGKDLLYKSVEIKLNQALVLEGYPNRDSISYKGIYGLNDAKKVLRGTLRYPGFVQLINAFKEIGYFDQTSVLGSNWLEYTNILLEKEEGQNLSQKLRHRTVTKVKHHDKLSIKQKQEKFQRIFKGLNYFGFLSNNKFYNLKQNNLENLIKLIEPKLTLKPGQTDLIAMEHRFLIEINGKRILRKSSLIEIGQKNGLSAMSQTVGIPTAIGVELILDGRIKERGVLRPIYKDIYQPCLLLLQKVGIKLVEQDFQVMI